MNQRREEDVENFMAPASQKVRMEMEGYQSLKGVTMVGQNVKTGYEQRNRSVIYLLGSICLAWWGDGGTTTERRYSQFT
jgi:hypothetical protein